MERTEAIQRLRTLTADPKLCPDDRIAIHWALSALEELRADAARWGWAWKKIVDAVVDEEIAKERGAENDNQT